MDPKVREKEGWMLLLRIDTEQHVSILRNLKVYAECVSRLGPRSSWVKPCFLYPVLQQHWSPTHNPSFTYRHAVSICRTQSELLMSYLKEEKQTQKHRDTQRDRSRGLRAGKRSSDKESS